MSPSQTGNQPTPPPRWRALLALITAESERELIREDLDEEYQELRRAKGEQQANRWYREYVIRSLVDWFSPRATLGRARGPSVSVPGCTAARPTWWTDVGSDLRIALRVARREPLVSFAVIVTMILGIGATTAVVSILLGVVVRPLPFPDADRLVHVSRSSAGVPSTWGVVGLLDFEDWQEHSKSMESLGAWSSGGATLTGDAEPERVQIAQVTEGMDQTLGLTLASGRFFRPGEFEFGANTVVLISHNYWLRRFGGDPNVVGRPLTLDGATHEVIGILPETDFEYPPGGFDLWRPLAIPPDGWQRSFRGSSWLTAIGRVRAGTTLDAAQEELSSVQRQLAETFPRQGGGQDGVSLEPLKDRVVQSARPVLLILAAAVAGVLLIACANVAVLLLSRANRRLPEFVVRAVLGGSRARLGRQLLVETLVLAAVGGLIGILVAQPLLSAILSLYPGGVPRASEVRIDGVVLAISGSAILFGGVLAGLVPARFAGRLDLASDLQRRGAPGSRQKRIRSFLAGSQVSLSAILMIGAGLFARTLLNLVAVDPGFRPESTLTFRIAPSEARYPTPETVIQFYDNLLGSLRDLPPVVAAGGVNFVPFAAGEWGGSYRLPEDPIDQEGSGREARIRVAWPGYYQAMGIRLINGRLIEEQDGMANPRVALLNEPAAREAFGEADPIGRTVLFNDASWQVVGVVAGVQHRDLSEAHAPELHLPAKQITRRPVYITLRTRGEPLALMPEVRRVVRDADPSLAITNVLTMEQRLRASVAPQRFRARLVIALGLLALALAVLGVYGVMSHSVAQRGREIGIRIALGEARGAVLGRVLVQALRLTLIGLAVGVPFALLATRWAEAFLFEVGSRDPATFVGATLLLLLVAALSAAGPAVRASRMDPIQAIRDE